MTFLVEERATRGPATHAIVIGVGSYPHLPGGGGRPADQAEGMGQLTSPPVSARAIANWLIDEFAHPDRPLADVALLISEDRPAPFRHPLTGAEIPLEVPTIDNLRLALTEWRQRGDARDGQRLIFYFCGHGMAKGTDLSLLAADYGAHPLDALDGAIDFRNFRAGMEMSKAREQVYFIDACRVHSGSLLRSGGYNGRPIFQPNLAPAPAAPLLAPVFYAALAGSAAYARRRRTSVFTEALLAGLEGAGADNSQGDWRITGMRLKEALDFHLERAMREVGRAQIPAMDNAVPIDLQYLDRDPIATAIVSCRPPDTNGSASLSYVAGGTVKRRPRKANREWVLELPSAIYEFRAEFPNQRWRAQPRQVMVRPTVSRIWLDVHR